MKTKEQLQELLNKFCDLMLEKEENVQSVNVKLQLTDKGHVKFKKFRMIKHD